MGEPVFPGDDDSPGVVVTRAAADDTGCGWVDLDLAVSVSGTVKTRAGRVAIPCDGDDKPWKGRTSAGSPEGMLAPDGCINDGARPITTDLNFTEEQKLRGDMVRNLCGEHASTRRATWRTIPWRSSRPVDADEAITARFAMDAS
ncbi:MAG: hypothetical protein IPF57_07720 [Gammaproteobacteria bacterium]|nr:hypothetical protein [Gammaproteobacteria bacterium]